MNDAFCRAGNILIIACLISCLSLPLNGCAPKYGRHDPDQAHALRTLAGGVAGVLIAGNAGGAIVGAFIADVAGGASIKYEDRLLENGDQAARRYREQQRKAEERKEQERKVEDSKEREQKAEEEKEQRKKAGGKIDEEKKAEEIKEQNQKAEKEKHEEKRVKLIIEDSSVAARAVRMGERVKADIQYTLLASEGTDAVVITETRRLWTGRSAVELDSRDIARTQGTYRTSVYFKMPDGIPKGYCILYTTISAGRQARTAQSIINII